ncbi:MAG: response regulator, partial [Deltaproteobacteria bacterium]|nr:response regulator [Deltaproteobacteria bacterium]
DFFRSLVRHLALILDTKFAFIARFSENNTREMRTLAVWRDNEFLPSESYILDGSATSMVLSSSFLEISQDAQTILPCDEYLRREGISSYMGTQLIDSNGKILGILAVMDVKTLPAWEPGRWILKIFAARAGAELERLAAEHESAVLQRKLMQAQKMEAIGQLAAGIAHDLNNALFAVAGHLQLMKMDDMNHYTLRTSIQSALSGCERASSLIGQLLCFSRQGKYNIQSVRLEQLVEETIDFLSRVIGQEIEITHLTPAQPVYIEADQAQLQQALTNLIINAKHAMPKGGIIRIEYTNRFVELPHRYNLKALRGNFACISISDTGEGIHEDNLERIFEPFFTTKDVGTGSGLGLAMVYGIMQNHGGWIEASSEVGKGSMFTLYFPIAETNMEQSQQYQGESEKAVNGCVLVIDDEPVLVDLMRTFLEKAGFSTNGFSSAAEALAWYKDNSHTVDLIVLDMKMPKISGEECFRRIRSVRPEAKVIILSGYIQDEAAQRLLQNGALRFLQKPVRYDELVRIISDYLAHLNAVQH